MSLEHNDPRLCITEQRSAELPTGVIGNAREVLLVKRHLLEEVAISPHRHQARRFRPRRSRRSPARATPDRPAPRAAAPGPDRKSVVTGTGGSVRVGLGGCRLLKQQKPP